MVRKLSVKSRKVQEVTFKLSASWHAGAYTPNDFGEDKCIVVTPALGHI